MRRNEPEVYRGLNASWFGRQQFSKMYNGSNTLQKDDETGMQTEFWGCTNAQMILKDYEGLKAAMLENV